MPAPSARVSASPAAARWAAPLGVLVVLLMLIAVLASIGGPHSPGEGLAAVLYATIRGGGPALAYLAAGVGLGRLLAPMFRGAREALVLQAGLGVSLLLTLGHLLGAIGVLHGTAGMVIAAGVVGAGLILLAKQVAEATRRPEAHSGARLPLAVLAGLPALALLLVAASNPPGWLWASEGRGYDVLEYHLQLPQEWLALGRIRPLEHNVYSFLPGYMESAFYFMAVLMGSPTQPPPGGAGGSQAIGLLAGDGMGALSAQFLHAGITLMAAWAIARLVTAAGRAALGEDDGAAPVAGALAGAVFLSAPWTIVCGSMAYNDLGVVLLTSCAVAAALEPGLPASRRGVLVGLLIGTACGVKPTAILFGALPAGIVLAGMGSPVRSLGAAAAAGAVTLLPWLVRNWVASGNPVFPELASVFGSAHWSAEQVARYRAAHHFDGSLVDRLRLIALATPDPGSGIARHRGVLHPQWSIFFPLVVAALAVTVGWRRSRIGLLLGAGLLAQASAWLFLTHIQARFLVPLVVPGAASIGLAVLILRRRTRAAGHVAAAAVVGCALFLGWRSVAIFATEGWSGPGTVERPNATLIHGPLARTGEDLRDLSRLQPAQQAAIIGNLQPAQLANLILPPGSRVYLLGDCTPFYYTTPVIYASTWDRSVLAGAIASAPGSPEAWTAALVRAGATHVLINASELERLERSGFLDPDLKRAAVLGWRLDQAQVLREWREIGVVLLELPRAGGMGR